MKLPGSYFFCVGSKLQGYCEDDPWRQWKPTHRTHRRFRSWFGVSPEVVAEAWDLLVDSDLLPRKGVPEHLLWTLYHLKLYTSEEDTACVFKKDEKTCRKWISAFLDGLADLEAETVSEFVVDCCFF